MVQAEDFPRMKGPPEILESSQNAKPAGETFFEFSPLSEERGITVSATLPDYPSVKVAGYRGYQTEKCLVCHKGIEEISGSHPLNFGCTVCHGGVGNSALKEEAHSTLIFNPAAGTGKKNPSHLRVADRTCGQSLCHSGHLREDRNHIERVRKSIMGTLAGVISGLRYQWAGQAEKTAKYGVYPILDRDGFVPHSRGAVARLEGLPYFSARELTRDRELGKPVDSENVSRHIGDSLLRDTCFQCHLDAPGGASGHRSQGCAACHMTYAEDGLYRGSDPTIDRERPAHPKLHKITALPPNSTCAKCHQTFSSHPAPGTSAPSQVAHSNLTGARLFPGLGQIPQDIHLAKGFDCIDCHTQDDIMGDGNLYSKQRQAVEVQCETCHGTRDAFPRIQEITGPEDRAIRLSRHYNGFSNAVGDWMVVSSRNHKMSNVKVVDGKIVTFGKRSGLKFPTPLIRGKRKAHGIPEHQAKLECTACHSQWVPRCKGCHATYDQSRTPPETGKTQSFWNPYRFTVDADEPALMVGPRGKVAPMLSQPPRSLSVLDEQGKPVPAVKKTGDSPGVYLDWKFANSQGRSGSNLAYAVSPHSVGKKARSCASCHLNPRALGLGEGSLKFGASITGKQDRMISVDRTNILSKISTLAPEAKVTIHGQPVAGSHQAGARPLNQEELTRILRVGNCIPCHDRYDDPIYKDIQKSYKFEKTNDHRKLRGKILNQR